MSGTGMAGKKTLCIVIAALLCCCVGCASVKGTSGKDADAEKQSNQVQIDADAVDQPQEDAQTNVDTVNQPQEDAQEMEKSAELLILLAKP